MLRTVKQATKINRLVDIIYIDKAGQLTKRRLRILKYDDNLLVAYCFTRRSIRTFNIENILAITPVTNNYLIAH